MAERLGVDREEFYKRYAHKIGGRWSLIEHRNDHGYDCVFLDRTSIAGKAVCSLYEGRPAQCRTWPFWPENLESKQAWAAAKRRTPCPGMDNGPLIPVEDIRIIRDSPES